MSGYGVLRNQAGDTGAWQLLEQVEPDEWQVIARGTRDNMRKLAKALNSPAELAAVDPDPVRPAGAITYDEVLGWDKETYLAARGRLWLDPPNDYRDGGRYGRQYTGPAAALMTGRPEEHARLTNTERTYPQPLLKDRIQAAETARDVAQSWKEGHGRGIQKDVRIAWPGLAAQLDKLAAEWADRV